MNTENRYKFLNAIYEELEKAENKHPKFCDNMTLINLETYKDMERNRKEMNSFPPYVADTILGEEIDEAMVAYLEGDNEHCLQELAQCGAVILRMMEFVQNDLVSEKRNTEARR